MRSERAMRSGLTPDQVRDIYDDMARTWRWATLPNRLLGLERLRRHFDGVTGAVLDVGCGTGENFRHLGTAASLAAIDISPEMVLLATDRALRLGMAADILVGDAADLPYPDDSFDVVISAFSTCTFPDHVTAFAEMKRVTKPGGRILLVEHGRSSLGWIARRQDRGVEKNFASTACRSNRDPMIELAQARLSVSSHQVSHLGMMNRFVVDV